MSTVQSSRVHSLSVRLFRRLPLPPARSRKARPTASAWCRWGTSLPLPSGCPSNIRSLDDDGQVVFIEVRSTIESDPSDPFEISSAELELAARKGSRYWIYRVVDTGTASPRVVRFRDPPELHDVLDPPCSDCRAGLGIGWSGRF
jgi:hypothetical protein